MFVLSADMTAHPRISLAELPDTSLAQMDFLDSTWFKTHGRTHQFPTPEHVRSFSKPDQLTHPVRFEDLGLIVKFGPDVSTSEAINLWAIRRAFQGLVPMPEVYGWRVLELEGKNPEVFIYMQLMQGSTLEQRWPTLSFTEKQTICSDLHAMVSCFRGLRDNESEHVIGKLVNETGTTLLIPHRFFKSWPCYGSLLGGLAVAEAISFSSCLPRLAFLVVAPEGP
jgi:hypothetical protein